MTSTMGFGTLRQIVFRRRFDGGRRSSIAWERALVASLTLLLSTAGAAYAASDVVITTSGDRLVGEIKKVEKDVLTFETDYSDSDFKLKWEKIASIESDRQFLVETFDGRRLSGTLKPEGDKKAAVQVAETSVTLPAISAAQPFEQSFLSRFDAGFDLGYSMTRANSAKQFSFGGNLSYRDQQNVDSMFTNMFRSSQENAPDTNRWELGNDFRHLLGERWYVNTTQDFLSSDEQQLRLRTTIGGGGGRYLLRSSSQYLLAGGGLAWTNEQYTDDLAPSKDSGGGLRRHRIHDGAAEGVRPAYQIHLVSELDGQRQTACELQAGHRLQPAGRLVLANRAVRELRQPPAGRPVKERLRLVECVRPEVLTSARLSAPEGGLS